MTFEVSHRINSVRKEKLKTLDLSYCKITSLPTELEELEWIEELNLNENKGLTDIKIVKKFKNLRILTIHNTGIYDLSPISELTNLKVLLAQNTPIQDLAPISNLVNLDTLLLQNTHIEALNPLVKLTLLRTLVLSNTRINDLEPLKGLINLTDLRIANTLVTSLFPIKSIIQKGVPIIFFGGISAGILINNCQLNTPPLEIAELGNEAILNYWEQVESQKGTVELYEAKLIIVGEGSTGKTTLFEKLKDPNHKVGNTPETHGINIHEGLPFQHPYIGENIFYANLWDFGGQDLQYMTHQFFLSPRALYVLMVDARRESPNLAYWFKIISLLGRESEDTKEKVKLLLVFNKRSNSTGLPQYQDILKLYDDSIEVHYQEVDFGVNDYRFENLQKAIQEHLVTLPIVKSQLPRLWKDVRDDLRTEAKKENYITSKRFAEICSKYNIDQEEDQWLLSGYLHQLGSLLHFQNDRGLRSYVILNPRWAVDGVYSFLTDEGILSNFGHFKDTEFIQLLAKKGYSREEADLILQLMTKNNFDICYEVSPGRYVAAQLLPDIAPEYPWFPQNVLQFRYQYSIMPKGLMSRLIVRLSEFLDRLVETDKQIVWKKGGVFRLKLREGECRVLLREDDAESKSGLRQIFIDVIGDANARKYALHKIRDAVEDLHRKWFRNIKVDEIIPCCCPECLVSDTPQLFKLDDMLKLRSRNMHIPVRCYESAEEVSTQLLLEGIYEQQEIQNKTYALDKF
ncbi:COR domain-containing protein [Haliscomenobacter hydrossis]|uniref:Leucine-rich repeat-containing protein n=1 Tax=Haliscomenobacter hydrossis (strain ATCC 27775 / DSM 1100 / LMG 10767 / O) TaxID=760192 RepID=F4KSK6_HALH1|nr:COR domain-containing protein [Haliscomenobacter hydrossis]AEE54357.1 leucine-rich repeat-containing protein [Haliscomenobacter hydrossis DSM 1100]